ncbi:hypothetical protein C8F04DRAFT_1187069 [Mycena alexandri]|uniref:Uncharacterized protein n=1 Tax=Mycena alexandri TaxID=1745969 RepID=A0AAD6SMV5_9AGAR|nr:hypothetical protein C8F04DRAFT_1187069 [Mycena alexandri]
MSPWMKSVRLSNKIILANLRLSLESNQNVKVIAIIPKSISDARHGPSPTESAVFFFGFYLNLGADHPPRVTSYYPSRDEYYRTQSNRGCSYRTSKLQGSVRSRTRNSTAAATAIYHEVLVLSGPQMDAGDGSPPKENVPIICGNEK